VVVATSTVSLEPPELDLTKTRMTPGRDGHLYFAMSGRAPNDWMYDQVIRVRPDGSDRTDFSRQAGSWVLMNATANSAGDIATTEALFAHRIGIAGPDFGPISANDQFLGHTSLDNGQALRGAGRRRPSPADRL
jgi:hypothetical protein